MFLTLLGVTMALLSFVMDYAIDKCQEGMKGFTKSSGRESGKMWQDKKVRRETKKRREILLEFNLTEN